MKLEMERTGQFAVNFKADTTHQCGVGGNYILHYKVNILASSKHLTPEGFIIDNQDVDRYFQDTYQKATKFKSCEVIAMEACKHFRHKINGLYGISVSISGNPTAAWLKSSWTRA